jgi:hypothetical protein
LISIGASNSIEVSDTSVWDTISMIYEEWMNMEAKNGNKPEESLIKYSSEWPADKSASESAPIVYDSIVKDSIVYDSIEWSENSIAPKVTTLEIYIKKDFSLEFITDIYNKYNLSKDDFQEECEMFVEHWKEKSPNWKKERWEKEKTFDPKLRFRKWMKNKKDWSKTTVVNLWDEDRKNQLAEIERKKALLFNKL